MLLAVVALGVLALDQGSKALAVAHLEPGEPRRVLGPVLGLDLTRNSGAAFSTATGLTWVLTVIAAGVVIVVIRIAGRMASRSWAVALGLLLGGALGNLTDRLTRSPGFGRGEVVDFLEFPHWPIFNLADTSIVCAGVLIVLLSLLGIHSDGRSRGLGTSDDTTGDTTAGTTAGTTDAAAAPTPERSPDG